MSLQKWEYLEAVENNGKIVSVNGRSLREVEQDRSDIFLNTVGSEGWELVGFAKEGNTIYKFKRPLPKQYLLETVQSVDISGIQDHLNSEAANGSTLLFFGVLKAKSIENGIFYLIFER